MRSPRRLVLGLALAVALIAERPGGVAADADDLGSLHREMLEILHGEPRRDVAPSPYYCWRHGRGPERPQMPDFEWYVLGKGTCSAVYVPDLGSIHSPLSDKGEIIHFFFDEEKYGRLESNLTRLASALQTTPLSLGDRFDLQMTVWELVAALQFRRDINAEWYPEISQAKVDRLLVPALKVLRATLFTREQLAALPSTLPNLAALSGERAIRSLAERLMAGDEGLLEDLFPSQLHNAFSQGRLFSRVFITLDDPAELERFQESLVKRENTRLQGFSWQTAPPVPEDDLTFGDFRDVRYLPLGYSSLRAVLVLFFNVLDTEYQVVPTHMVATWDELWWSKKLEDAEDLRAADRALGMRIVKYQKQLGFAAGVEENEDFPRYRSVSEDEASRVLFTDVNPVYPDIKITTVRGQCLSCHSTKLMTYNMHLRKVGFVPPFSVSPEGLGGRKMEGEAGRSFREWTRRYLEPTEDER
jgi:hypothetical protein